MKASSVDRAAYVAVLALAAALAASAAHAQKQDSEERRGIRVRPEGEVAPREPAPEGVLEDEEGRGVIRVYPEGEAPAREPLPEGVLEDEEGRGAIRVYPEAEREEVSGDEAEAPPDDVWVPLGYPEMPYARARRGERARDDGDGLACFLEAKETTLLSDRQALGLCELAATPGPAACYRRAQDETTLREHQIIDLCRCATTTRPVDCVHKAQSETFLDRLQVIDLCRATKLERRYRDCTPIDGAPPRFGPTYGPRPR